MDTTSCSLCYLYTISPMFPKQLWLISQDPPNVIRSQVGTYGEEISIFLSYTSWKQNTQEEKPIHSKSLLWLTFTVPLASFLHLMKKSSTWLPISFSFLFTSSFSLTSLENRSNQTRISHSFFIKTTNQFASISTMEASPTLLSIVNISTCALHFISS